MIYVDSNVFVYYAFRHPQYFDRCRRVFEKILSGEMEGAASVQALSEVYNVVRREKGAEKAFEATAAIMSMPLEFVESDMGIFVQARDIAGRRGLSIWDAMHVASALRAGADKMLTNDRDFEKIPEIEVEFL